MASPGMLKVRKLLKMATGFEKILHNVKIISAEDGKCSSEIQILPEQTNILKVMHGGFATILIDVISSCALLTHERRFCGHVSVNLNIDYDFSRVNPIRKEAQRLGIPMRDPSEITLEKEYERLKSLDIDNWEQVRGPRPWEENFQEKD